MKDNPKTWLCGWCSSCGFERVDGVWRCRACGVVWPEEPVEKRIPPLYEYENLTRPQGGE